MTVLSQAGSLLPTAGPQQLPVNIFYVIALKLLDQSLSHYDFFNLVGSSLPPSLSPPQTYRSLHLHESLAGSCLTIIWWGTFRAASAPSPN